MGLILKRNFCFDVNGRFESTWCVTLYCMSYLVLPLSAIAIIERIGGRRRRLRRKHSKVLTDISSWHIWYLPSPRDWLRSPTHHVLAYLTQSWSWLHEMLNWSPLAALSYNSNSKGLKKSSGSKSWMSTRPIHQTILWVSPSFLPSFLPNFQE